MLPLTEEPRPYGARNDGIDVDVPLRKIHGEVPRQAENAGLAAVVVEVRGRRLGGPQGRDIDDLAVFCLLHGRHDVLAVEETALEVERHDPVELLLRHFLDRRSRRQAAGVVDEDIYLPPRIEYERHGITDLGRVGGVALDGEPAAPGLFDERQCLFRASQVDVRHRHAGAFFGEHYGRPTADTAPAPGDDGGPVFQQHGFPSLWSRSE